MSDLPLTIPVVDIIVGALSALRDCDHEPGLDRDEAYLLARLEAVDGPEQTVELLRAIEEAPR